MVHLGVNPSEKSLDTTTSTPPLPVVTSSSLPDLQNQSDERGIHLERVGVEKVKFPIKILRKPPDISGHPAMSAHVDIVMDVQASVDLYASVAHDQRGTNMSRFLEVLMAWRFRNISSRVLPDILKQLHDKLQSPDVFIALDFDYFLDVESPVTHLSSIDDVHCELIGMSQSLDGPTIIEGITIVGTNCCPCSKEISERGAHNQRIELRVRYIPEPNVFLWFEDIAEKLKGAFSCPIYPLLKRPDEKYVTETAYDNPKFSEDVAREAALILRDLPIKEWQVKATAKESIHHHDAITYVHSENWDFHR